MHLNQSLEEMVYLPRLVIGEMNYIIVPSNEALFFIFRGDASGTFDKPVAPERVLGKVIAIERNGGSINPYCLKHKLASWAYKWASRIRRNLPL